MFFWLYTISIAGVTFWSHLYANLIYLLFMQADESTALNLIIFAIGVPLLGIPQLTRIIQTKIK